jgi:hypothetical protein
MRSLFALLGGALVAFFGLGWYFGWYTIVKTPTTEGHTAISIDVNTKKVKDDVSRGAKATADKIDNVVHTKPNSGQNPPAPTAPPPASIPSGNYPPPG